MHISLKISCSIPDEKYDEVAGDIKALLETIPRFEIKVMEEIYLWKHGITK